MNSETSTNQIAFNLLQKARNKFEAKKYATALQYCQAALAIYEEIGDSVGIGCSLANIGNIYSRQAVEFYHQARSNFEESSNQLSEEIAQVLSLSLESEASWYASDRGNIVKLSRSEQIDIPPQKPGNASDSTTGGLDDSPIARSKLKRAGNADGGLGGGPDDSRGGGRGGGRGPGGGPDDSRGGGRDDS
ncbi:MULTISPECIES: tetratricopeptide repeat protein [unclassified Microcoleus]|uniref:tetratricopeptide repeat protein n=1 Tax=unclassified Microcoleus TaxID=2642155 RepID=UPI002FD12724